ncbi:MAG TPA: hypothetical protein VLI90_08745 [Tepidisphaeraceae bacterium]|nr:hypothetical protein [Tepidisphaeraceae bacterium]
MSKLVSRILLAIFMLPLATVVYMLAAIAIEESMGYPHENGMFIGAGIVTWGFVAGYWLLLWGKSIAWTPRRIWLTVAAAGALLLLALGATTLAYGTSRTEGEITVCFSSILAPLWWLIFTVFIWRESAAERTMRIKRAGGSAIACPNCGYNLTGLAESRCPECGSRFTLDELLAAQPAAMTAEID